MTVYVSDMSSFMEETKKWLLQCPQLEFSFALILIKFWKIKPWSCIVPHVSLSSSFHVSKHKYWILKVKLGVLLHKFNNYSYRNSHMVLNNHSWTRYWGILMQVWVAVYFLWRVIVLWINWGKQKDYLIS